MICPVTCEKVSKTYKMKTTMLQVVIDCRDELKFNEHGVGKLISFNMISMKEFCIHLAQYLEVIVFLVYIMNFQNIYI